MASPFFFKTIPLLCQKCQIAILKMKFDMHTSKRISGGYFERNAYCNTALGWLKKVRKKMNNLNFWPFQVRHLRIVSVDWAAYISCSKFLWTLAFAVQQNYRLLIGAAILLSGHPYIWAMLPLLPGVHKTLNRCNYRTAFVQWNTRGGTHVIPHRTQEYLNFNYNILCHNLWCNRL